MLISISMASFLFITYKIFCYLFSPSFQVDGVGDRLYGKVDLYLKGHLYVGEFLGRRFFVRHYPDLAYFTEEPDNVES